MRGRKNEGVTISIGEGAKVKVTREKEAEGVTGAKVIGAGVEAGSC